MNDEDQVGVMFGITMWRLLFVTVPTSRAGGTGPMYFLVWLLVGWAMAFIDGK